MTKSHKILILIPPLLIAITILLVLFAVQHRQNEQAAHEASLRETASSTDYTVTNPVPDPDFEKPGSVQGSDRPRSSDSIACTMDAKECPDGSYVGRIAPNCAFAACPSNNGTKKEFSCSPESREAEACIEIYAPVCASYQVQCVTTPCPPFPRTYPNSCFACSDNNVLSYTEGACSNE